MSATIRPMPRPRGTLSPAREHRLGVARYRAEQAQARYRDEVVGALADGASFSWVSEVTGLSTNTLQRWKREAGK
jgi:hypothetical protein